MDFKYITARGDNSFLDFVFDLDIGVRPICLDTETTGLDVFTCDLLLIQVKVENNIYIFDAQKLGKSFITEVVAQLRDSNRTLVLHNAKFDLKVLLNQTGILLTNVHDTMWTETLINAGIGDVLYSLASLVEKYIGIKLEKEIRKEFYENFSGITQEQLIYSALDVAYLDTIREKQLELISKAREERILELENKLVPVVASMEFNGVKLDTAKWAELATQNSEALEKARNVLLNDIINAIDFSKFDSALVAVDALKIPVKAKRDRLPLETITETEVIKSIISNRINLGSHDQLLRALNIIGVPLENTNEKTMKDFRSKYDIIDKILTFREAEKSCSTYGLTFLENIHPKTGRIHTEFMNMGAATGRFSSKSPKHTWAFSE